MTRPMRRSRMHGISLVELMLGMFIFATAFLMILGVFPTSVRSIHQGRLLMLATHVAQQAIDAAVAQPYSSLVAGTTNSTTTLVTIVNGETEAVAFNTTLVISDVSPGLTSVRCQVSWIESRAVGGQMVRYVNMETMVADLQ